MMTTTTIERPRTAGKLTAALSWTPTDLRTKVSAFALLCVLALLTLIVLYQVPYRHTVLVGGPHDAQRVRGFFDAEGTGDFLYRWTEASALVRLPQGVFPGEADIVLSGNRPGSTPPRVALGLGGQPAPITVVQSTTDFVTFPVRLPAGGESLNPAETPDLSVVPSDTAKPPKDNRVLGVAVERVVVYTNPVRFGPVVPPLLAVLLILGIAAALALVALSAGPAIGPLLAVTYGPVLIAAIYLALQRADDPGQQVRAVLGFAVAALVAMLFVWRRTLAARPWVRALARLDGRWLVALAVLLALGYALYASHRMFGRLYDDTHITLRYAENFADGDGLRFNPGQQPVEGYTNFLLTVFLAGCAKIGLPLLTMAKIVSIGAALGVVIATYWLASLVMPGASGLLRATPSLVMAGCGWFAFYAAIGLETHLFALLVTVAACLVLREKWPWAGAVFAAAYLTRPEGAGLWVVTLAWLVWQVWLAPIAARRFARAETSDGPDAAPRSRDVLGFALPFVVIAGAHEVWRLSYYGEPVPNTFYDKVGTAAQQVRRGIDYVLNSLPQLHPATLALLALLLVLIPSGAIRGRAARYIALLAAAFVGYIILVGGDFIGPRFLFHVFPFIVVLAVAAVRSLLGFPWRTLRRRSDCADGPVDWAERASPLAALSVALIALWLFVPLLPPDTFLLDRVGSAHMRFVTGLTALGEYLRETAPPDATLAIDAAGAAPYISRLPTLDMLGLSDFHIAHTVKATGDGLPGHEKTDPAYILAQQPTYIAVGMSKVTSGGRPGRGLDLPGFDAQYARVALVKMTATVVSPSLVLILTPQTDVEAAIADGYTYALYEHK
jgi:arabinofuranosyltransferase